ncbi:SEL1-like repeat protein [Paenibacillus elgii]|uniref:SEL1-like repeat protein n=1 Tax=Paenibacillus elgii TaxID=189691 RepID=UPI000248C434|nr:SEL1-like repeat protein [Paenibacillus elgii]
MSHRVYLYNVSTPSEARDDDTMMMEWGYEMPLLLQPLLVDGGFIDGNNYNNHTEPDNAGLYYNARAGIENLKRFYEFLEKQEGLIADKTAFVEAKTKLLSYLEKLDLPYFHLDAWDVFNMDDIPHAEQVETWRANIAHNNEIITKAMDNEDVSLLRYSEFMDVSPGFTSFEELLNYPNYEYGWVSIWKPYEDETDVEIFEENGLWGLKDKAGNILLIPQFDEFFDFSCEDLAVVSRAGKFGYVYKSGKIVIPLVWDDAFDFEYGTISAIVKRDDKFGLINLEGRTVAPTEYESLEALAGIYFTGKKDGGWGVLDQSGSVIVPFEHEEAFQFGGEYYHTAVKGRKSRKIFNESWSYIGDFPLAAVEPIGEGFLLVKPHKDASHHTLYKKDGMIGVSGFDKLNRQTHFPNLLILRKGKKHGAFGKRQESLLLPYEYDALIDLQAVVDSMSSNLVLAQKDGQKGVFDGHPDDPSWLFPLDDYEDIVWLYEGAFALKRNGLWSIAYSPEKRLSDYEFDLVARKAPVNGFAYAFKGPQVYTAGYYGMSRADKAEVLEDASDKYYDYYFDADVRKRLLAYAKTNSPDSGGVDEYTSVEVLYSLGVLANDSGDYDKAIEYDTLAAEKGYAPSMNNLGQMYYAEDGYIDNDKAFYWYEKGAAAGNLYAMNGLGCCYQHGIGTDPDADKALYWFGEAAEQGLGLAHNNLGSVYFEGELVPQNLDKALWHYEQGEALGSPNFGWLGYLYDYQGNYEKALHYYLRDYEGGSNVGAYNLGILYSQGLGAAKDPAVAITYFNVALERDYPHAHIELARIYRNEQEFVDESLVKYHLEQAGKAGLDIPDDL